MIASIPTKALKVASAFANKNKNAGVTNGIYVKVDGDYWTVAATDSFRLVELHGTLPHSYDPHMDGEVVVPRDVCTAASKDKASFLRVYWDEADDKVEVSAMTDYGSETGRWYTGKPIKGEFPAYRKLFPRPGSERVESGHGVAFDPAILADALKALQAIVGKNDGGVRVEDMRDNTPAYMTAHGGGITANCIVMPLHEQRRAS